MRALNRFLLMTLLALSPSGLISCGSSAPSQADPLPEVVYKPRITINNISYKSVVLGVKGPETRFISIPARSSKSVNLYSGDYKYAATDKDTNTITVTGYMHFGTDRNYVWNFSLN